MLKTFTERVAVANACQEQFRWCWPSEVEEWFSGSDLILSSLVFYIYRAEVCPEIVDREKSPDPQPLGSLAQRRPGGVPVRASRAPREPGSFVWEQTQPDPSAGCLGLLKRRSCCVSEKSSFPYGGEGFLN